MHTPTAIAMRRTATFLAALAVFLTTTASSFGFTANREQVLQSIGVRAPIISATGGEQVFSIDVTRDTTGSPFYSPGQVSYTPLHIRYNRDINPFEENPLHDDMVDWFTKWADDDPFNDTHRDMRLMTLESGTVIESIDLLAVAPVSLNFATPEFGTGGQRISDLPLQPSLVEVDEDIIDPTTGAHSPEPTSLALLGVGALLLTQRRRRRRSVALHT